MRSKDIIALAQELKKYLGSDPFEIAKHYGINVIKKDSAMKNFKASIVKANGYSTTIFINERFSELSQKVLCAHELGHALLHEGTNTFAVTSNNVGTNVEYEANLFAVCLLFEQKDIGINFSKMDNYTLQTLLEFNLH